MQFCQQLLYLFVLLIPFARAQFTLREIYQDNPIAGENNNIYVRLRSSSAITEGNIIYISNLANAISVNPRYVDHPYSYCQFNICQSFLSFSQLLTYSLIYSRALFTPGNMSFLGWSPTDQPLKDILTCSTASSAGCWSQGSQPIDTSINFVIRTGSVIPSFMYTYLSKRLRQIVQRAN